MSPGFWRGRRVLVTGHTGFKGAWLSLWLQALGAEVTGFALAPPTEPSLFELANVASGMHSTLGDVRDPAAVQAALDQARPEVLVHMAAQSLVRQSYADPVGTYATNVMGTVNVLDAARRCPSLRAVLVVTSDKCYENREWAWGYRENEPMGGHDPYSNSKGCAELVTEAYRRSFLQAGGVAVASARAGNVIGGGDWAKDRLVPDAFAAFSAGRPLVIRHPHAVRPWQHVLEPLSGYLALCERLHEGGADVAEGWNFGPHPEDARPVAWVAQALADLWGDGAQVATDAGQHAHEAYTLKLDTSKAQSRLNWRPRLRLGHALEQTVRWAKAHAAGVPMRELTCAQIEEFQREAIASNNT